MDGSQVTGAASSYARKYALNGLFNIDDTKDSDTTNDGSIKVKKDESQGEAYICCDCGKPFRDRLSKDIFEENCIYMRLRLHYSWTKIAMKVGGNNKLFCHLNRCFFSDFSYNLCHIFTSLSLSL